MTTLRTQGLLLLACCLCTVGARAEVDSFETARVGTINGMCPSPLGSWMSSGQAEISLRRTSHGTKALRIFGGDNATVSLRLTKPLKAARVTFDIERWTARNPFLFTVEVNTRDGWTRVYEDNGSEITIGNYNFTVDLFIDSPLRGLRFVCTAPSGGGCLIDKVSVQPPQPMELTNTSTQQRVLPLLRGGHATEVANLEINTRGMLSPLSVRSMTWAFESSGPLDGLGAQGVGCDVEAVARRVALDDVEVGVLVAHVEAQP